MEAAAGFGGFTEEDTIAKEEMIAFAATGKVQALSASASGVNRERCAVAGVPLAFAINHPDVAVVDLALELSKAGAEVFQEAMEARQIGLCLGAFEASHQSPFVFGFVTKPAGVCGFGFADRFDFG